MDSDPLAIFDLKEDLKLNDTKTNLEICANFDSTGVVLAVAIYKEDKDENNKVISTSNRIDLFDVKKYEEGRFDSWKIDNFSQVTGLKFSNNGFYILANTVKGQLLILDAFEGSLIRKFNAGSNGLQEASFTPDSKYVISGTENGTIFMFDIDGNKEIARLEGHVKPSTKCKFSPTSVMMASACQNIVLWLPKYWD